MSLLDVLPVSFGLTSHSVIFQLYSDGVVVMFQNLDLLSVTFLQSEDPHAFRERLESSPDYLVYNPVCYLFATATDTSDLIKMVDFNCCTFTKNIESVNRFDKSK